MTSKEFILKSLPALVESFPMIKCRYEYRSCSDMHLIEVSPDNILDDVRFSEESEKLVDSFLLEFPLESIAFLSSSSLATVSSPIKTWIGATYMDIAALAVIDMKKSAINRRSKVNIS
ncbi:hypothetical protein [Dyadobacter bucti]|uniref:hypothetical protein n=1 Tax=Dyadobacter bucti TaxID=2572203 RepID=UPI003F71CCE9